MAAMAITYCIINFNGEHHLPATLQAVRQVRDRGDETLLIDSASTDGSVAMVHRDFPELTVVELGENRGPGRARNVGYRRSSNDVILFIDNDVTLTSTCPQLLAESLGHQSGALAAMPMVLYEDEPSQIQFDGAVPHFLGLARLEHPDLPVESVLPGVREIDSLITACFMMDKRKWSDDKPFDEEFFLYLEDHEFGLRARLLGHRILAVPQARCLHREGTAGVSLRATGRYSSLRVFEMMRNRWQILLKLYQARTLIILSPAFVLFELFQLAGMLKKGWLPTWWKASSWVVSHLPDIMRRRREFQRMRRLPDRQVLHGGPIPFTRQLFEGKLERLGGTLLDATTARYWSLTRHLI